MTDLLARKFAGIDRNPPAVGVRRDRDAEDHRCTPPGSADGQKHLLIGATPQPAFSRCSVGGDRPALG